MTMTMTRKNLDLFVTAEKTVVRSGCELCVCTGLRHGSSGKIVPCIYVERCLVPDGDICQSVILKTFVVLTVSADSQPEYGGKETLVTHSSLALPFLPRPTWYEQFPDTAYNFSGITISAETSSDSLSSRSPRLPARPESNI